MGNNLRREVDAERESGVALKAQVDVLSKRLEDAKCIGLVVAKLYVGALEQFGGSTPPLPSVPSAFSIFSWLKANFLKLPNFVGVLWILELWPPLQIFQRCWRKMDARTQGA